MQTGSRRGPLRSEDTRRLAGEARPLIRESQISAVCRPAILPCHRRVESNLMLRAPRSDD